jgi:hypothetical protein
MRVLDLFCGRFGWGKAFAARGHEVVGIDLVEPPEIPDGCTFFNVDILKITADSPFMRWDDGSRYFDFICASSPCNQFTMFQLRCFHKKRPYPSLGIELFNHTRKLCEESGLPYIQENVRAAQDFVGNAVSHCGPFYLWGNAVPPILPQGITKGFGKMDREFILSIGSSKSKKRAEHRAKVAEIPPELANAVCDYAERLVEVPA